MKSSNMMLKNVQDLTCSDTGSSIRNCIFVGMCIFIFSFLFCWLFEIIQNYQHIQCNISESEFLQKRMFFIGLTFASLSPENKYSVSLDYSE